MHRPGLQSCIGQHEANSGARFASGIHELVSKQVSMEVRRRLSGLDTNTLRQP